MTGQELIEKGIQTLFIRVQNHKHLTGRLDALGKQECHCEGRGTCQRCIALASVKHQLKRLEREVIG